MERSSHILYFKKVQNDSVLYQAVCISSSGFSYQFSPFDCTTPEELGTRLRGYEKKEIQELINSPPVDWQIQEERFMKMFNNPDSTRTFSYELRQLETLEDEKFLRALRNGSFS
ncbi:Uncharacterised protein [uncultured archaeon]|nr:Uncharacterised protein [uncultured archaeon]